VVQVIMTFTLISVVYACGIAKPGHGSMTPIVVGFSLVACAGAGAKYTGDSRTASCLVTQWGLVQAIAVV
jgi:glycerol uptake facilitator-like aquaporin